MGSKRGVIPGLGAALGAALLVTLAGCSGRTREPPIPEPRPHPQVAPVEYGWIHEAFAGHPFLILREVRQRAHRLPGKCVVELGLRTLQPEGLVRHEIERIHRVLVQPDQRLQAVTYNLRGLGEVVNGVLQAHWGRGYRLHWTRPNRPTRPEEQ